MSDVVHPVFRERRPDLYERACNAMAFCQPEDISKLVEALNPYIDPLEMDSKLEEVLKEIGF